jgi:hypothetical protein
MASTSTSLHLRNLQGLAREVRQERRPSGGGTDSQMTRSTHTYATLGVSQAAYDEIAEKLRAAEYHHAFDGPLIDMHGIALEPPAEAQRKAEAGEPLHVAGSNWARLLRASDLLRALVKATEENDNCADMGVSRDDDVIIAARAFLAEVTP